MVNLLPQEEQRRLRHEYIGRVGVVGIFFLFLAGIMGLFVTLPATIIARQRTRALQGAITQSEQATVQFGTADTAAILEGTKQKMAMLSERATSRSVHAVFLRVVEDRVAGIAINNLSYTQGGSKGGNMLDVGGVASTREDLIAFTKRLEGEKIFAAVHLPIASLTLDKNIDFSLSIVGAF